MEHNQFTIKTFMSIMAERDAAIRERNMALEERKRAFAERDMAMLQRDAALTERNSAIQERNEAIATFRFRESLMNDNNLTPSDLTGAKQIHTDDEMNHMFDSTEAKYSQREITGVPVETARPKKVKRTNEKKAASTKPANSLIMGMKGAEDLSKQISTSTSNGWKNEEDLGGDEENLDKDDSWLNQVNFEESALPVPVCSCTGVAKPCYKWGNGGWQSACCTTAMSANLLPQVSNKRYSRVGARKMSGNVFAKLLNRLADEGHDLSAPLDLKDHWAKHGTNRYSSLK